MATAEITMVKRYGLSPLNNTVVERDCGCWVLYDDYKQLEAQLAQIEELQRYQATETTIDGETVADMIPADEDGYYLASEVVAIIHKEKGNE